VLVFRLEREGLRVHDAEIWVCFDGDTCLGLVNRVPAGLATPPAPPADAIDPVYAAIRGLDGAADRLVVAERRRRSTPQNDLVELVHEGAVFLTELTPRPQPASLQAALFTEFSFGGFPDQIAADSRGMIWCSDPTNNRLLKIDPQTGSATFIPTSPWGQPDGLTVDDKDQVWTGFYTATHGLGRVDAISGTLTRWAAPYANAQMAIPTWNHTGTIFVTDHANNRISEFNPTTGTFGPGIVLAASTYPVGASFDSESGDLFVTFFTRNAIGQIRNGALLRTLPTPVTAGPAFCACANGKVWFSYWSTAQIGALDVASGAFTTFNMPAGELGGPIDIGPNGHVYVGTRGRGYIVDFDPITNTSVAHPIPTPNPGVKDGLTVAPDGSVWITGSFVGRVVRLRLP
jgi:streptogramin lyase